MSYIVGISSGIWSVAKAQGAKQSEQYAGLSKKIYFSLTQGVNFVQLDLEKITEFLEPDLKDKIKKLQDEGYNFGIHGECAGFGSRVALDSSVQEEYKMSHESFKKQLEYAHHYNAKYLLFHSSEALPFLLPFGEFKEIRLVDPWGQPMNKFLDENPKVLDWAISNEYLDDLINLSKRIKSVEEIRRDILQDLQQRKKELTEEDVTQAEKKAKEEYIKGKKEVLKKYVISGDHFYLPDRIAYTIMAKWMEINKHPIWKMLASGVRFDGIERDFQKWVPAVTALYFVGHFSPKGKFENLKDLIDKYKIPVVFETPMPPQSGYELYMRLSRLKQIYAMISQIGSPYVGIAVDFEHLLTCHLDPVKEIEDLPSGAGKYIRVIHTGVPAPYEGLHLGIDVGSDEHVYLYKRLFELRKRGFESGFLIFERGSQEAIKDSIVALRLIVRFLEKDIHPNELPDEFYGLKPGGSDVTRQEVAIKEHALDPLKGLIIVPEEEYGFLSTEVGKKGKLEQWKKEEYK